MTDAEWLDAMFAQPERDLAALPTWARPVVTPDPRPRHEQQAHHDATPCYDESCTFEHPGGGPFPHPCDHPPCHPDCTQPEWPHDGDCTPQQTFEEQP